MIFKVIISAQAENDLRGIFEYITFELLSPENAEKQLDRLEKQILSLDEMPERFPRYGKEPWYSRGLRFVSIDNYIVFYIPDIESIRNNKQFHIPYKAVTLLEINRFFV